MPGPWDRRSTAEQARHQNTLLRQTVMQLALGHVPFVRSLMGSIDMDARAFRGFEDLYRLPLALRGDVFDVRRNPEGPRGMVLHGTSEGVKRFADRASLWRVATARLFGGEEVQQRAVEAATRPIHFHLAPGRRGDIPVAYTRDDLDLFARAGARLASVLGFERTDRLANLVPAGPTLEFWGMFYAAHGFGIAAQHLRKDGIVEALRAARPFEPTIIAVPGDEAVAVPAAAAEAGLDLAGVRVIVPVGRTLTPPEREELFAKLAETGAGQARVASAFGTSEGRVLWGECSVPPGHAETYGFHTYPDMDLVEVVAPDTGRPVPDESAGEVVVTALGFRGGGAPRWRSGDFVTGGLTRRPCPNCGRTVPRVGPGVIRRAWERQIHSTDGALLLDLRDLGAATGRRASEWQIELGSRNGKPDLFVYLAASPDDPELLISLYEDLERIGLPPAQIVLGSREDIAERRARASGAWPGYWER
jgi:hypothetical protein